jgi:hypothetical protein
MNASLLDLSSEPFAGLNPGQVAALLKILREVQIADAAFIESIYRERERGFKEALSFLRAAGWIEELSGKIVLSEVGADLGSDLHTAIECLANGESSYRSALEKFFSQFESSNRGIAFRPSAQQIAKQSGIRNFLIGLGIVSYDEGSSEYLLEPQFVHLFVSSKAARASITKVQLQRRIGDQGRLGDCAELAAFEYEKRRVGARLEHRVKHVSIINPTASFDIRSISINGCRQSPRFIEVKAVSNQDFQFFWTASELEAARLLKQQYFLYLLPVSGSNTFDLQHMDLICDPYETIYQSSACWEKSENLVVCRKK